MKLFDIGLVAEGEEVEPDGRVRVEAGFDAIEGEGFALYHIVDGEAVPVEGEFAYDEAGRAIGMAFETDSLSPFAVTYYTVDFHWQANGKTYKIVLPGGGFASFSKLVEVLGVAENGTQADSSDVSVEATEDETEREPALTLDAVEVSDKTRSFVSDVEKVEFSSPELVWVGKVERENTVGALKEANELEVEYSAELTEEQIAEINAQTVEAGDWALISMQPFTSEETLTVTMKNGEQF